MFVIIVFLSLPYFAYSEDICKSIYCGSGKCIETENPTLPYYCQCQNGSNTILPCPTEDPCSQNPCGQGTCDLVPNLIYGYVCRCLDDTVSLTGCNVTRNTCATNPCLNGVCIEGLTSFICNCLPTWTGRFCDVKIDLSCPDNLCGSGKCFPINDPSFPYVCLCPDGEFAISCQKTTTYITTTTSTVTPLSSLSNLCNPMNPNSCMNSGQCLPTINGYRCLCTSSFTGPICEIKISACTSYPCLNGGTCYDLQSSYICACVDGTFRSQCSPTEVSTSTIHTFVCPCQNGGVCTLIDSQICTCPNEYSGRFCENLLSGNTCREVQCHNDGTCHENSADPTRSARCLCKNGYTGQFCEIEYFRCRSNGRFTDQYNCGNGKYFECIHYYGDGLNQDGRLLSRYCPSTLRFNVFTDRCDYPKNVQC